ncbi:hypothetical protein [Natrialba taiwanensis]|uniref:Uncharacterized protein n=1 Tax=Natrialba taiwanensis DSM 12281 TaxID=1230458 RepID=L9ZMX8_9EURY|nr:hypothetical protein [Natrialba taiwanensis]ELY86488.1 hypothetical protein C484_18082 [Natrialba taiwanensis DSM 12281]
MSGANGYVPTPEPVADLAASTAFAAEREHGDQADVLCIDVEADAKAAWERRREDELEYQSGLRAFVQS